MKIRPVIAVTTCLFLTTTGCASLSLFGQNHTHTHYHYGCNDGNGSEGARHQHTAVPANWQPPQAPGVSAAGQ